MKYPGAQIALLTREPVAGKVKTRLIPALGSSGALALFESLLQRQIEVLQQQRFCRSCLWVDGDPGAPVFQSSGLPLFRQQGEDLGQRMHHIAGSILKDDDVVILIGSDCPDLDEGYLEYALQAMYSGADVVIGPAADGGYVLLGLRQVDPALFAGVEWGSPRVLEQTIARVRSLNLEYLLLHPLSDIDRPEDLRDYPELALLAHNALGVGENRADNEGNDPT